VNRSWVARSASIFNLGEESGILRISIAVTVVIALFGIGFGLISGSFAIAFDGIYSLVDACMSVLALVVVNLIASYSASTGLSRRLHERFTMGFWHLEPIVLGLNGVMLIGVSVYALVNAVASLLGEGRDLEFGWAIVYAAITLPTCFGMAAMEARANRRIGSAFVKLDGKSWMMSGGITAALLVAFCIGYAVQGTAWEWTSPYIDPAVLALVSVILIPMPISTVRQALADIFLVTPPDLKRHVDGIAQAFVDKMGFLTYRAYVARVGRARQIELYFIVPEDAPVRSIVEWDRLRDQIGEALVPDTSDNWVTIVFTADPEWAE
jgi:predicted Co/Zn/Cd cation transporter (cation efflux family)